MSSKMFGINMFHEDWHLGSELSKNKSKRVNKDAGHPTVFHLCLEKPHALGRDGFGALSGCLIEVGDPADTAEEIDPSQSRSPGP